MGKKRDDIDALVAKHRANAENESDSDPDTDKPKRPFVDQFWFNMLIGFFITLNAFTMGLETDARGEKGDDIAGYWYLIELGFCIVFFLELSARIWFHRMMYFCDPQHRWWNIVDAVIVAMSVADALIITPIGMGGNVRLVSMLRFIRLMRLIRLVRLMHIFKELWLVANGLIESAKTLCWVALMIICFIYICAIFTTLMIGKNDDLYDSYFMESGGWDHELYFRTVPRSMFTLFQIVTFESWSEGIVRHVMQKQPAMVVFFVGFIAITSFGLLNIVVGVVVESTLSTSEKDENRIQRAQERDRQRVFDHLRDIFEAADEDGSGTLTLAEVQKAINKPEIYNKLKMIEFPVEDPRQIFMLLDFDNTYELSIDEFIAGCIRMKGTAKSKDLLAAQVAVDTMKRHYTFFEKEMKDLQDKIRLLDETARALVFQGEHVFLNLHEYRMRHPELEGARSSMPVVTAKDIERAPWEQKDNSETNNGPIKQEALWNEAFNKPENNNMAIETYNAVTTTRCHACGALLDENSKVYCTNCGKRVQSQALADAPRTPAIHNALPPPPPSQHPELGALENFSNRKQNNAPGNQLASMSSQPARQNNAPANQLALMSSHQARGNAGPGNQLATVSSQRRGNATGNQPGNQLALPGAINNH